MRVPEWSGALGHLDGSGHVPSLCLGGGEAPSSPALCILLMPKQIWAAFPRALFAAGCWSLMSHGVRNKKAYWILNS